MRAPRGEHLHAQRLEEEGGGLANRALDVEHRWLEHVVERAVTNRERPTRRAREGAAPVEGIPRLVHGAPDEGGNQWSSVVISGHQWSSDALSMAHTIGGRRSVVIRGHQRSSDALSMPHTIGGRQSVVISGHQTPCPRRTRSEGGDQWSSEVIRGHQTPCPCLTRSEGGNQWSSVVIRRLVHGAPDEGGNQWSSVVISGHQTPCPWRTRSEGGNQWSSVVISGHQWSSDALSMAHMIGGRRSFRPSARASASALPSWAS